MKKLLLIVMACLAVSQVAVSQTQQGVVRTLEKPNRPSVGIEGVTVNILEYPNALVSKKGGKFSFSLQGKKQGDAIRVSRVTKKGYTLADSKGRKYAYSATVPIEIVMVSDKQLASDKKKIEDKAYARAKKTYEARIAELECQLEEKAISEQAYYAERERLSNDYDKYIQLIDEMAERYAMTDYKGLSDINCEIMECIENAELERADSLINSKGDFNKREQDLREQMELNQATAEFLEKSRQDAEFKLNDLAQDYNNKYTIFASRYQNDSAAYYLERRAALDTTNIEWHLKAGQFINDYLANYSLALEFFQLGLRQAIAQYGEQSEWTATFYYNLGEVYYYQGDYTRALEYHQKALDIYERVFGSDHPDVAMSYNNIGSVYSKQGDYSRALEYHQKALDIYERVLGSDHPDVALSYHNIGSVYNNQGDYAQALDYYQRALDIWERVLGPDHPDVATSYNNIGLVYDSKGEYDQALEYYLKALSIRERVLGPDHPSVATFYTNIGALYDHLGYYDYALEYYQKSLAIDERVHGLDHPDVATNYNNIGFVYYLQGDYVQAMEHFQKALAIRERAFGPNHPSVALYYNNIGLVYCRQGDYSLALEYYEKALAIYEKVFSEGHPHIKMVNYNIETVKYYIRISSKRPEYLLE